MFSTSLKWEELAMDGAINSHKSYIWHYLTL